MQGHNATHVKMLRSSSHISTSRFTKKTEYILNIGTLPVIQHITSVIQNATFFAVWHRESLETDFGIKGQLKCDGTRAETRCRLTAKRTSPFINRRWRPFSRLLAAEVCASAVVMLDTPCSEVVWRVLATHSIRQFPLHFPARASPCAITFQMGSTDRPKTCCIASDSPAIWTQ